MMYDANNECWEDTSPEVEQASRAMEISPDFALDIRELTPPPGSDRTHQHVAVQWAGGVLWLDLSDLGDHFCIDVRQFVPDPVRKNQSKGVRDDGTVVYSADGRPVIAGDSGTLNRSEHGVELAGQGVFTIVNGRRQALGQFTGTAGNQYSEPGLADPDGTPVRGHGWNGGYVVTLMHDKAPSERQTNRPAGPGRG